MEILAEDTFILVPAEFVVEHELCRGSVKNPVVIDTKHEDGKLPR
jgi:hypothetical protein